MTERGIGAVRLLAAALALGAAAHAARAQETAAGAATAPPALSISVIPDAVYRGDDAGGEAGERLAGAAGFEPPHGPGADEGHGHGDAPRGFSLREVEVAFTGTVDPYFDLVATFAVADGDVEVEEVYARTRRFLPGLTLQAGRFFSAVGYANGHHPHQFDFVDQALPWQLPFGGVLADTGIRLTWLPALPVYTTVGVEALQGDNEFVAQALGDGDGARPWFPDRAGPRLFTAFAKVAPDFGTDATLQVGVFGGHARQHDELHDEDDDGSVDEAFTGTTTFFGTDWVFRRDDPRAYGVGDLKVQAEYVLRRKDLDRVLAGGVATADPPRVRFEQDAVYAQATYGFAPRLTAGLRAEAAGLRNRVRGGGLDASFGRTTRAAAVLTFDPSEFSRVRLQYQRGSVALAAGGRERFAEWYLQVQFSLGAHGAHRF